MRKLSSRPSIQLTFVTALLLLLAYLFWQSRPIDRNLHEQILQNINTLQQADAKLNELLLKVSNYQLKNYDPVNQTLAVMDQRLERLSELLNTNRNNSLCNSIKYEQQHLVQKHRDWEEMASHTAVLKNSLYYASNLLEQTKQQAQDIQQLKTIDNLAQQLFYVRGLSQASHNTSQLIDSLADSNIDNLSRLRSHAQIIEENTAETAQLLDLLLSQEQRIGANLEAAYRLFEEKHNQKADSYQTWLALIAALLLLLTAFNFHRLQAAYRLQAHLRKALDEHTIVSITNPDGIITYANEKFCHLSGYTKAELKGQTHRIVNSGYHSNQFFAQFWQTIRAGEVWHGQVCNRAKTGEYYWLNATVVPFFNGKGDIKEYISIRTDITEQKHLETHLIAAKETAEAASRIKSDFLSTMSHEIRTPMNGILGMTELVLDTNLNDEQREYIQIVKDSADALMVVINDILDLSKIESGKFELDPQPFSVAKAVSDTVKTLEARATQKGLIINTQIDANLPIILIGDAPRLRQILLNLLSNAVKFTQQGNIDLQVSLVHLQDQQVQIKFIVSDTGTGIAKDKLTSIFEAFSQADNSVTRQYGGTGLGLAICSRLVEMMSGQIWVESELGHGSRFSFTACFVLE